MSTPRVFWIDTDTAADDAVALIMALRHRNVAVAGIGTVCGNVPVRQATQNALFTVALCNAAVPVHEGAAAPLSRRIELGSHYYGRDGLGDRGYALPEATAARGDAANALIAAVRDHPGLTLVTLGPLTNLALALAREPALASRVGRCVVMGGAPDHRGNVTPAAEYNFWIDPEAARSVLGSALPIELVGWQLAEGAAALTAGEIARLDGLDNDLARFALGSNASARDHARRRMGEDALSLADPVAMAVALDRSVGTRWSRHHVEVETTSALTRGMSVVDRDDLADAPRNRTVWAGALARGRKVDICWSIDAARWKAALYAALREG